MIKMMKNGLKVLIDGKTVSLSFKNIVDYVVEDHPKVIFKAARKKVLRDE